jgi:hypothetical protein
MRSGIRLCIVPLVSALLLVAPAIAQQIRFYPDFSNTSAPNASNNLKFNGVSALKPWQSQTVLRLTDGATGPEQSSTYFDLQQPMAQGFTTWFQFQVHNNVCCMPGDGFAFVIQNATGTNSSMGASGSGLTALGAAGGGLGYAGINNSLAVEFDILDDPWDPNSNHIAIQTCGGLPSLVNTPVHLPGSYTIGQDDNVTSCLLSSAINTNIETLGGTCNGSTCTDGAVHQVVIQYTPPAANQQLGLLEVWLDPTFYPGTHTPVQGAPTVLSVPYNIVYSPTNPTGLALGNGIGTFWVGFTASQPLVSQGTGAQQDIFAWTFTTHSPTQITQVIPNGGIEANYVFGAHQAAVNYPAGFMNDNNIKMTVLETPWNQQTFYNQRLLGTPFSNENCIIYLETGGDCVVYSVTCQNSQGIVACPEEPPPSPGIAICTKFYTSEPISANQADFLSADPIGSNNWCSIFQSISNNNDTVVSGKGTGFSDLVATFTPERQGPQCSDDGLLQKLTQKMKSTLAPPPGPDFCPPESQQ